MRRYKFRKTYVWTPTLAYCVGLIATDGSLSVDNRHIDFTSKDYDLTETYRSLLCPHAAIGVKSSGQGNTAYRVQLGDVALYDFLVATGLTPCKSKTLPALSVPNEFYRDFLRGCFDGDGSTFSYWDPRWKSSFMYYLAFVSASESFLQWIRSQNVLMASVSEASFKKIGPGARVHTLSYAKADTKLLHDFMYYQEGLPCLERKRDKLARAFEIEKGHSIIRRQTPLEREW